MADTNPGGIVATIKTVDLIKIWGETITIKRSKREGARYPLYLSPSTGPVHLNTSTGQDGLLEYGQFRGAESVEKSGEASGDDSRSSPTEKTPEPVESVGEGDTFLGWLNKPIL